MICYLIIIMIIIFDSKIINLKKSVKEKKQLTIQ